ncbi:vanadium-dependent haloperoxidase [Nonomuraea rhizosphaerae]|uniref:vanadium-dependent haloperoxidase n=1 Tax=Nonomuraea rhizosphaerae TaxID=2665663 RepID=UPI001C5EC31D|nr:vanadium-dependent haloperoxidase [Nonomuraea rhizosphaerae]
MRKTALLAMLALVPLLGPPAADAAVTKPPDVDAVGSWNTAALEIVRLKRAGDADAARTYAMVNVGMYDAVNGIATARGDHARTSAIQQADTDGNPYTDKVDTWRARAGNPGTSPEYVSGHSTFSGAAAAALAGFFCDDRIPFTLVTDSAPIDPATGRPWERRFPGFSAAAGDAGRSRVFGGLHFEFSNRDGLAMGSNVAAEILARRLLLRSGPTHVGACPR